MGDPVNPADEINPLRAFTGSVARDRSANVGTATWSANALTAAAARSADAWVAGAWPAFERLRQAVGRVSPAAAERMRVPAVQGLGAYATSRWDRSTDPTSTDRVNEMARQGRYGPLASDFVRLTTPEPPGLQPRPTPPTDRPATPTPPPTPRERPAPPGGRQTQVIVNNGQQVTVDGPVEVHFHGPVSIYQAPVVQAGRDVSHVRQGDQRTITVRSDTHRTTAHSDHRTHVRSTDTRHTDARHNQVTSSTDNSVRTVQSASATSNTTNVGNGSDTPRPQGPCPTDTRPQQGVTQRERPQASPKAEPATPKDEGARRDQEATRQQQAIRQQQSQQREQPPPVVRTDMSGTR